MSRNLRSSPPSAAAGTPSALSPLPLLIGLFAGPILWSLHLVLSEILVSSACTTRSGGLAGATVAGLIDWRVALVAVSVVFVLAVAAADLLAFECWKRSQIGIEVTGASGGAPGRTGWMSLAGLLLNTFFLIGILFAAIPLFWLTGCGG